MLLWNNRVNLCRLSGCLKGELVLTITPDGTLKLLSYFLIFIYTSTLLLLFLTYYLILFIRSHTSEIVLHVYCKNHFSRSWNISNENIYNDMTKCDVNACICTCMCTICALCMCVHAYISMLWIFYRWMSSNWSKYLLHINVIDFYFCCCWCTKTNRQ